MPGDFQSTCLKRRKFIHYSALSMALGGLVAPEDAASAARTAISAKPEVDDGSRHLDLATAKLEARQAADHEYGLGVLLLDEYTSASFEALEYLVSLELFVLHLNLAMLTPEMAGVLGHVRAETLSLGERVDQEILAANASFDPVHFTELDISSVRSLTGATAANLVNSGADTLSFWAFDGISLEAVDELVHYKGNLCFRAEYARNANNAAALARFKGRSLELVCETELSANIVEAFKRASGMRCSLDTEQTFDGDERWALRLEQMNAYAERRRLTDSSLR